MIEKDKIKELAEELRRFIGNMEDASLCEVVEEAGEVPAIKVVPGPKNTTGTFFFGTEVVDFCRGRGLTFWIGAEMSGGYPYAYAYIY